MKNIIRYYNSFIVRFSKILSKRIPLRLIWLQNIVIEDVSLEILIKKLQDVEMSEVFHSEHVVYPRQSSFCNKGILEKTFPPISIICVHNGYFSPLTGLCFRYNQYFIQSVGSIVSCFGYRNAFRQIKIHRFVKKIKTDESIVVANTNNISHFILEDLPGIIRILTEKKNITIVIRKNALPAIHEILKIGFNESFNLLETNNIVFARKCYFLSREDEQPFIRPSIVKLLRNFILSNDKFFKSAENSIEKKDKIYISRKKSKIRSIENEEEVERCLKKYGFSIVYLEEMSFSEQVACLRAAKIIVGLHGAGMTNILWANQECKILEIFTIGYTNPVYEMISYALGFSYKKITCINSDVSKHGRVSINDLEAALDIMALQ